ncbi:MAG: hypothetical protein ACRCZP_01875 [Phycicoccus sp.]
MNTHADEIAAAKAALDQLVTVAITAARAGQQERSHRVTAILRGHGPDGVHALLHGAADAVLGRPTGQLLEPMSGGPALRAALAAAGPDDVALWCARYVLARARLDTTTCHGLVDTPPKAGLLPAMCALVDQAARTHTTHGDPA